MRRGKIKAIISTVLLVLMLIVLITGIAMYFVKGGIILGIPRYYVTTIHVWCAFILAVFAIVHFILNAKIFKSEWTSQNKKK